MRVLAWSGSGAASLFGWQMADLLLCVLRIFPWGVRACVHVRVRVRVRVCVCVCVCLGMEAEGVERGQELPLWSLFLQGHQSHLGGSTLLPC